MAEQTPRTYEQGRQHVIEVAKKERDLEAKWASVNERTGKNSDYHQGRADALEQAIAALESGATPTVHLVGTCASFSQPDYFVACSTPELAEAWRSFLTTLPTNGEAVVHAVRRDAPVHYIPRTERIFEAVVRRDEATGGLTCFEAWDTTDVTSNNLWLIVGEEKNEKWWVHGIIANTHAAARNMALAAVETKLGQATNAPNETALQSCWRWVINQVRIKQGVEVHHMAAMLRISTITYSDIEAGRVAPTPEQRELIDKRLGVDIERVAGELEG